MKAMRIPIFVLAALLAFSVWNAVHLTRRCALWQQELAAADSAAIAGDTGEAAAALARLRALWQADQVYLHIVVSHEDINNAETLLCRAAVLETVCVYGVDLLDLERAARHQDPAFFAAHQEEWSAVIAQAGFRCEVRVE